MLGVPCLVFPAVLCFLLLLLFLLSLHILVAAWSWLYQACFVGLLALKSTYLFVLLDSLLFALSSWRLIYSQQLESQAAQQQDNQARNEPGGYPQKTASPARSGSSVPKNKRIRKQTFAAGNVPESLDALSWCLRLAMLQPIRAWDEESPKVLESSGEERQAQIKLI